VTLDWWLALCAWLPLPVIAWLARRVQGQWLAPGALIALAWTLAAGVPLFLAPDLPVYPGAYGFVLLVSAVCVLASTMGASIDLKIAKPDTSRAIDWPARTWQLYYALIGIGCIAPVMLYGDATSATRAGDLAELAMYTSMGRYGGEYEIPTLVRLLTASSYVAATISGVVTSASAREERKWSRGVLWILPLVATVVIHTEKAGLLYGLVMFAAGWAAGRALARHTGGVKASTIFAVVLAVFVLLAFFVAAQSMRMNRVSFADIPFVLNHLRIYVVGHMPVFGHWWTFEYPRIAVDGFGTHTFAGMAELMGLTVRKAGLYVGSAGFTESNIYTALRPLLEDFGIVGALAFMFVLAYGAGVGWRLLVLGRRIGAVPVVGFTAYVLWSPITSIFVYSTIIAVVLAFSAWTWWVDTAAVLEARKRAASPPPVDDELASVHLLVVRSGAPT
jgi:oligosaccharide repeat unit polymerase